MMRALILLAVPALLVAGCTDPIPVKEEFGTSALRSPPEIAAEFAEFNTYDVRVDALVAQQMCATPYHRSEEKVVAAEPGEMVRWRGSCERYRVNFVPEFIGGRPAE
jgi:hypothetical protein